MKGGVGAQSELLSMGSREWWRDCYIELRFKALPPQRCVEWIGRRVEVRRLPRCAGSTFLGGNQKVKAMSLVPRFVSYLLCDQNLSPKILKHGLSPK